MPPKPRENAPPAWSGVPSGAPLLRVAVSNPWTGVQVFDTQVEHRPPCGQDIVCPLHRAGHCHQIWHALRVRLQVIQQCLVHL